MATARLEYLRFIGGDIRSIHSRGGRHVRVSFTAAVCRNGCRRVGIGLKRKRPSRSPAQRSTDETSLFLVLDYANLVREGKDALVRKHAAKVLERMGEEARPALAELRKALGAETDQGVKAAIQQAITKIDPPLDQLRDHQITNRLQAANLDAKTRKQLIEALGHERFATSVDARRTLQRLLLDPGVQVEAAASLEKLEEHRAKKAKRTPRRVDP